MERMYVGPKQKTIENNNFFDASITLVGNNKNGNVSFNNKLSFEYWNPDNNLKEIFFYNEQFKNIDTEIELVAHDPYLISKCVLPKKALLICKNSDNILNILNDKIKTHQMFNGVVPMLNYKIIKGSEILAFDNEDISKELVIQLPYGGGGSKTYICKKNNIEEIKRQILLDENYSISEYEKDNISYNTHCIIGKKEIEILAPSEQILEINHKIEFIGSEFVIKIEDIIKEKMIKYSMKICEKLQKLGYRGVLGIDWIYANDELFFIEINPRFQGSTRQVDMLLKKSNLPSIFELNYLAFYSNYLPNTKNMLFSLFLQD